MKKKKNLQSIALVVTISHVILIIYMMYLSFKSPKIVPDLDLHSCPPLTNNPKRIWAYWREGPEHLSIFSLKQLRCGHISLLGGKSGFFITQASQMSVIRANSSRKNTYPKLLPI